MSLAKYAVKTMLVVFGASLSMVLPGVYAEERVESFQELAFTEDYDVSDLEYERKDEAPEKSTKSDTKKAEKQKASQETIDPKSKQTLVKNIKSEFEIEAFQAESYKSGRMAFLFGQYDTAMERWLPLAEQGYAKAQATLGWMYHTGKGVKQDKNKALEWYMKAADQNHTIAQNNLGVFYEQGLGGVTKNLGTAAKWYRESAEWGYSYAQYNLGLLYRDGRGVKKDMKEAQFWLQIAALQGVEQAVNALQEIKIKVHPKKDSPVKPTAIAKPNKPDTIQFHGKSSSSSTNAHGGKNYQNIYERIRSEREQKKSTAENLGPDGGTIDGISLEDVVKKPNSQKSTEKGYSGKSRRGDKSLSSNNLPEAPSPIDSPAPIVKNKIQNVMDENEKNAKLTKITRDQWIPNQKFDQWLHDAEEAQQRLSTAKANAKSPQGHSLRIFNEKWVREQNPKLYTLQLARSDNLEKLLVLAKKQVILRETAYFTTEEDGQVWYYLIYGMFDSIESASQEIEKLPNTLKKWSPYVRRFSNVQKSMKMDSPAPKKSKTN